MKRLLILLLSCVLCLNNTMIVFAEDGDETIVKEEPTQEVVEDINLDQEQKEIIDSLEEENFEDVEPTVEEEIDKVSNETEIPELLTAPVLNGTQEEETDLTISQAADGSIIITAKDASLFDSIDKNTYLLIYYYDSFESPYPSNSRSIYNSNFNNYNDYEFFETNQGFEVKGSQGNEYILISEDHCKAEHIGSGIITVSIKSKTSNKIQLDSVVKKLDKSINAYEDKDNHRFVIECEDKDFLQSLLLPCWSYTDEDGVYHYSWLVSNIAFSHFTGDDTLQNRLYDNNKEYKDIIYDEQSELIYISEEVFKARHIQNGIDSFDLSAYGYEEERVNIIPISSIGCLPVPTDINVYQNNEGDLIIESDDEVFLQALVQQNNLSSSIWDSSNYIFFEDSHNNWQSYSSSNCCYDDQNNCVCIPYSTLISRSNPIQTGYLEEIQFSVYGYERKCIYYEPNDVPITKGVQDYPNDITVEEDSEGNIIIHSENLDFLEALVLPRSNNSGYGYSRIEIAVANNSWHYIDGNWEDSNVVNYILNEQENTVSVKNSAIINSNISNGQHNIRVVAFGYSTYSTSIELSHACQGAPSDVNVEVDSDSNIIITCEDTQWISALASGHITFFVGGYQKGYVGNYNGNSYITVSNNGCTATISAETIASEGIPNGTYTIMLFANGYETLSLSSQPITITKGAKTINPSLINIIYDQSKETIKISSSNKDFIEKLAEPSIEYYLPNGSWDRYVQGGSVAFDDDNPNAYSTIYCSFSNYKQSQNNKYTCREQLKLSSDHKSITISKKDIYNQSLVKGYDYILSLSAKGYQRVNIPIKEIPVGVKADLPDDITVEFIENKGIVISSNDISWINNIALGNNSSGDYDYGVSVGWIYFQNGRGFFRVSCVKEDEKIVVPMESLYRERVTTRDNYGVRIRSYGYREYISEQNIHITGIKEVTSPVTVKQGEDDLLIIESEDKDYLRALCSEYTSLFVYYDDDSGYCAGFTGSGIQYDEIKDYGYIDIDTIVRYLNRFSENWGELDYDNLHMHIEALGYETVEIDYSLKFIECEDTEVVAGATEQLSFADFDEDDVVWTSSNEAIATIDENGLLKGVKAGNVKITANYNNGDAYDSINIKIAPNTKISIKLQTQDKDTLATVGTTEQLDLVIKNYTLADTDVVQYESRDTSVATVSNTGELSFLKPGVVTITATAIGKTASLKLSVYNVDKTKKVSLSASQTLFEVDEEVSNALVFKAGDDAIDNSLIALKYTSSNPNVITVDENNGAIKGISKGSAKITVELVGDPSKRKATISLQVVDTIIRSIDDSLTIDTPDPVIESLSDTKENGKSRVILVDYSDIDKNTKFHINTTNCGKDRNGNSITPSKVSYVSTDSSIASVDKNGYVQFKKAGQVTITVTIASNPKGYEVVSKDIIFKAIDYAPRIETNKFSINKYYATYPSYNVYKIMDTDIEECSLTELNGDDSSLFEVSYSEQSNKMTIKFKDGVTPSSVAAKSYSQLLQFGVDIDDDEIVDSTYKYKISVIVTQTLPAVSFKVNGYYNTFTKENTLELATTVKNASLDTTEDGDGIKGIEFVNDWADYEYENSVVTISPNYVNEKPVLSGIVRYRFDDYITDGYIDKTIKLPSKLTKPTVKLNNSTITIFNPNDEVNKKEITITLSDKNGNVYRNGDATLSIGNGSLDCELDKDEFYSSNGIIHITLKEIKNGKVLIQYKDPNWSGPITNTLNIKVNRNLPNAKLSSNNITVNTVFDYSEPILITLPGSSESISTVEFDGDDGIDIVYNGGQIAVDPATANVGTYKIKATPKIANDTATTNDDLELKQITFTVKVVETMPTFKFKSSTIKLNQLYSENANAEYMLSNNPFGANLVGVAVDESSTAKDYVNVSVTNSNISLSLKSAGKTTKTGNYTLLVKPKYDDNVYGPSVKLTINIYNKAATANVTVKDAFNPFNSDCAPVITTKLTNIMGNINTNPIGIVFDDSETLAKNLFEIQYDGINFILKAKDGADWSEVKDQTIKAKILVKSSFDNEGIESTLSIKIARKAPTIKLTTPTINVYDTTVGTGTKVGETAIEIPEGYEIDKTNSVIPPSLGYTVEFADNGTKFVVKMLDGSKIKAGSTSSFNIKLIWKNDYTNNGKFTKSSTIKMNVKDMSYSINTVK